MPYQKEMKMLLLAAITNDGSANGKISRVPKDRPGLGGPAKRRRGREWMCKRIRRTKEKIV